MHNATHPISLCPLNSAIGFPNIYPLDSDLSGGYRYSALEQPGPDDQKRQVQNNTHCSTKNMFFSIPQKLTAFFSTNQTYIFFKLELPIMCDQLFS